MSRIDNLYRRSPLWCQEILLNFHAYRIHLHRYGRPYRERTRQLREMERWPVDRLAKFKNRRLRRVIEIAYEKSAFYRTRMDEVGVEPADIVEVGDLVKLPLLTKEDVRANRAGIMTRSRPRRTWWRGHTSGTTGTPLSLWYDRSTCVMTNAVDARLKSWVRMGEDDWIGLFLGRMIVERDRVRPPFWRTNWIQRQVWFSSFHLSEDLLGDYVNEIRRRSLMFLEGYPSTLYILARYLIDRGETLPMKAVITSSETLHVIQRKTIQAAFDCPLFDFYAMAERTIHAGECEVHEGKHVAEEYGHVEIVDEHGNPVSMGEPGYLVGTSLWNTAMPMIRYRSNDMTFLLPEPCECGRTLIRMGDVATKAEDVILTTDGRWISPSVMTHPFKSLRFVAKSQIIQNEIDCLTVKIVPKAGEEQFRLVDEASLRESLTDRLGSDMQLNIVVVDDIKREESGKFRWVISRVDKSQQIVWEEE